MEQKSDGGKDVTNADYGSLDVWRKARTLADLGKLTAQWIEGVIESHPCNWGGIDAETVPLKTVLVDYNTQGFVTTFSQPAEQIDKEGCGQRACVQGYTEEGKAKRIAALGLHTDLVVLIFPPGECGGYQIPITIEDFHPGTWCGRSWGYEDLEFFAQVCSIEARYALEQAWNVTVIDPKWGRESYLWENVSNALRGDQAEPFEVTPSPSNELDTDFVY